MKDNKGLYLTTLAIGLAISAVTDLLILKKLFKTKTIATENNREIYDHDKVILQLQEDVEALKAKVK